ncbi:hypothetical protein BGZ63DRAFT_60763 [Mariannaea sp. PMI_226]|nr:hypothetical protein BGZ63DRAFT_60763 [Mariannaea sp. PMI_226]
MKYPDPAVLESLLPIETRDLTALPSTTIHRDAQPISRFRKGSKFKPTSAASSSGRTNRTPKSSSPRIVFGPGVLARLPAELGRLQLSAPLIVCSPSRADLVAKVKAYIPNLDVRILDPSTIENFPAQNMDDDAITDIHSRDCVVSVGGGSAVAVARIVGSRKAIPHICIPTTYSGNEVRMAMPSYADQTKKKRRRREELLHQPTVIIYDEDLTMSSPRTIPVPVSTTQDSITHPSESSQSFKDTNLPWSYLHLPGV